MATASSLVARHPSVQPHLGSAAERQRARMLDAITTVVAEKGYAAATVADVVRAARVSRRTFYDQFSSKEECFLESYRYGVDVLVARITEAARAAAGDGWRAELRAGIGAYLTVLKEEPRFARTHMLELHAAGAAAQSARDDALRRFAGMYRRTFEAALGEGEPRALREGEPRALREGEPPGLGEGDARTLPSDQALFILAAGVDQLVCAHVRGAPLRQLPELQDAIVTTAESLLRGFLDPSGDTTWT